MINLPVHYLSFLPLVSRIAADARVLPSGEIDFTASDAYQMDLTAVVQSAQLAHPVQGLFVDASGVLYGSTTIQVFGTGQKIVVPAGVQGYYPILCTQNTAIFTLSNPTALGQLPGTGSLFVFFINIPVVAAQWSSYAQGTTGAGGGGYGIGPLGANPLGQ